MSFPETAAFIVFFFNDTATTEIYTLSLHDALPIFAPEQPDLNWENDDVRREHEDVLRFWFDRGVAGVRIDSAALLFKDGALPDLDPDSPPSPHPFSDRDELHDVYRSWRSLASKYAGERILIGEIWLED